MLTSAAALIGFKVGMKAIIAAAKGAKLAYVIAPQLGFMAGGARPFIKSIQSWTITIAAASTTGTVSITAIAGGSTLCSSHLSGMTSDNGALTGQNDFAALTLSGSTLTATRTGTTGNLTITGYSIDWDSSFVKSVQYGTASITTTNTTANGTISAVVQTNSAVQWLGCSSSIAGGAASVDTTVNLTSTTNVQATRYGNGSATIVTGFCVLEFQSGVLNSNTQEASPSQSTSALFAETTISAVTLAQCWLVYGGRLSSNTGFNGTIRPAIRLKDTVTVRQQTNAAVAISKAVGTVVEFKAANMNTAQRGNANPILDASNPFVDVTITTIPSTSKAIVNYLGEELTTGSSTVANVIATRGALTSTSNLRLSKNTASSTVQPSMSWEVIPFNF